MRSLVTDLKSVFDSSLRFTATRGNLILAATVMGAGMVYLDGTIVTVALPQIQKEFNASVSGLQWLIDIYILFLTIPILVAGSLSDRYGRKKLFNIGLVGFTVASAACGAAGNLLQLNIARVFQGVFGAIMLPGSLAILNATFPPRIRGRVVGTWSAYPEAYRVGFVKRSILYQCSPWSYHLAAQYAIYS